MGLASELQTNWQQHESMVLMNSMLDHKAMDDKSIITRKDLDDSREALLFKQMKLAREFYAIEGDSLESQAAHRAITEQMTKNAIDLMLPGLDAQMRSGEVREIALMLPLRGALAMATDETLGHLQKRLKQLGFVDERGNTTIDLSVWTQGIKRDGEAETAGIYFTSGYSGREDFEGVHVVFMDWGMATGASIDVGAKSLKEKTGIGFGQMTSVAMTMADKAKFRLRENCVDESGAINVLAATRARLNEVGYIHQISHAEKLNWESVTPKDWGAKMWGMEIKGDSAEVKQNQIEVFIRKLDDLNFVSGVNVNISAAQLYLLKQYYEEIYLEDEVA